MLEEIEGSVQPSNIALNRCPFWLRLYNFPLNNILEKFVRVIGDNIGVVLEVESDGVAWDMSARFKVLIDVTKPLRRIQKIKTKEGGVEMVEIKYERVRVYYDCGGDRAYRVQLPRGKRGR